LGQKPRRELTDSIARKLRGKGEDGIGAHLSRFDRRSDFLRLRTRQSDVRVKIRGDERELIHVPTATRSLLFGQECPQARITQRARIECH
jgi:hypothetical protein